MQNISLTKIAGAVKRLEADSVKAAQAINVITQHENKLQEIYAELRKLQNVSSLTEEINELKTRSIDEKAEMLNRVDSLKKDILDAINEKPILITNDEKDAIPLTRDIVDDSSTSLTPPTPEFKSLDITNESKYSDYGSLDDVIQISLGDTKISIDKDDKNREICSLTNEVGGLAFKKKDCEDIWLLDRNKDSEMEFHFNSMENTPFGVNPSGISLNGTQISTIAKSINDKTINDKSIPTVNAIVKYINANLQKMNLINKLSTQDTRDITVPECNISTIATDNGNSLLIENESNSFSLKDDELNIISISASSTDGLRVGNKFKLNNDAGMLCKFVGGTEASVGKFVELTGSAIKIDDLIIPEVKLTNKLTSMVYGIIKSKLEGEYVKENKIYVLNGDCEFVSVIKKGLIEISVDDGSFGIGSLLVAGKNGIPIYNADAIQFCINKKVPMVKVISKINDNLVVEVV